MEPRLAGDGALSGGRGRLQLALTRIKANLVGAAVGIAVLALLIPAHSSLGCGVMVGCLLGWGLTYAFQAMVDRDALAVSSEAVRRDGEG